ncbi:tumor necrosis factor receptor superfamily member 9 [Danio aesculapii]|uniref:tumor necrosis factor receptor superfamily member 9 n=1 Tax=Danio aesculapii TaxID=1142201 RepID=UPI0024BF636F|nr:tumor necrosis factor receptor superfamily member 9 [Danio aesculapii]
MFCDMKVLSIFLYLLLIHRIGSATGDCPAGQKVIYTSGKCENCPKGQYSPKSGNNVHCHNCSKCKKGSRVIDECTPTSDTQCRCMQGFTPVDTQKEEVCVCKKGSGVNKKGNVCQTCSQGFFTDKDDTACQRWKECKSGVNISGTTTSDVVCNNIKTEEKKAPTILTPLFWTAKPTSAATSGTTTTSVTKTTSETTAYSPGEKADSFYIFWLIIICATTTLLLAGFLYGKRFTHYVHNLKKANSRKESTCRKPVEESGEKCLSLLV